MKNKNKEHILVYKIFFTIMIIAIYVLGRNISVYGVDVTEYQNDNLSVQTMFLQSLSGDSRNISIFVLGLWPYMIASMLAILVMALKALDKNSRTSANYINVVTLVIMMVCASIQAINKIRAFEFMSGYDNIIVKAIVFCELIAGMLLVIYMCDMCTKYGLGGKSAIFLVNILDGIVSMVAGKSFEEIKIPILIGIVEGFILILLDNTEKRIPVLRVSIHNIYADKNYIAFSFAAVGIMPMMFASAFFALVQMIMVWLAGLFPENVDLLVASSRMQMTDVMGMIVYIVIIWIINIAFSFLMLKPYGTAEGLSRSGDSLENIYAGKQTKKYLIGCVLRLAIYSSIVYSVFMIIPFALLLKGMIDSSMLLLPTSMMMTTGLWLMLYREAEVYVHLDKYKAFI